MPDWEEDSSHLRDDLAAALAQAALAAERREPPTLAAARNWQKLIMLQLEVPDVRFLGGFRGEPGLEKVHVRVGAYFGVAPQDVSQELREFETKLQMLIAELDAVLPRDKDPQPDQLHSILEICAWTHSEWVRIHPFVNGNGRTARLWANSIAMRYGLPAFLPLRPRPRGDYAKAAAKAMKGEWEFTALLFRRMLDDFLHQSW